MRTPPPPVCDLARSLCTQFDDHLGCGVMPLPAARQTVRISTPFTANPLLGGAKRTRSIARCDADVSATPAPSTILVPQHAIAVAQHQNWCGTGALLRIVQHDTPPRPIKVENSTKQQCRAAALYLIQHLPSSAANSDLRVALAKIRNDSHSSPSLKYPASSPLHPLQLLQAANNLSLPVVLWEAPAATSPPTYHRCTTPSL